MQEIHPIKVRDLPRFLKAIEPIATELAAKVLADVTKSDTGPLGLFGRVIQAA
jgi:hypothetical protein